MVSLVSLAHVFEGREKPREREKTEKKAHDHDQQKEKVREERAFEHWHVKSSSLIWLESRRLKPAYAYADMSRRTECTIVYVQGYAGCSGG
jgi:hypothetical protein